MKSQRDVFRYIPSPADSRRERIETSVPGCEHLPPRASPADSRRERIETINGGQVADGAIFSRRQSAGAD